MENASKALIIAATSMIALMILAAMVYLFRQGSKMSENYDREQIQRNLELYNSRFLNFNNDRNTISDIISVCNLAYNTNIDTDYDEGWCVQINVNIFNKIFSIPSKKPNNTDYKRNMIFRASEHEPQSIYNLTAYTMDQLGYSKSDLPKEMYTITADKELKEDVFKRIKLNEKVKYKIEGHIGENDPVTEGYLFLFECSPDDEDGIQVNSSGRVCEMNFNAKINPEIGKIVSWEIN